MSQLKCEVLERRVLFETLGVYELWTTFRLGGSYTGLYRVLGGLIKGHITNFVQGSYRDCKNLIRSPQGLHGVPF